MGGVSKYPYPEIAANSTNEGIVILHYEGTQVSTVEKIYFRNGGGRVRRGFLLL